MNKIIKTIAIVLGVLVVVVIGALWYITSNFERIAHRELSERVAQATNGLYLVSAEKPEISIARQGVYVDNLLLYPDTVVVNNLRAQHKAPRVLYNINAGRVGVKLNLMQMLRKKVAVSLNAIQIENPNITITEDTTGIDTIRAKQDKNSFKDKIIIDKIELEGGYLTYRKYTAADTLKWDINNVSLKIDNVVVDSAFIGSHSVPFGDMQLSAGSIEHMTKHGYNKFSVKGLSFNLRDSSLAVDSLGLIPQYPQHEYVHIAKGDYTRLSMSDISVYGLKPVRLLLDKTIDIDSIYIRGGRVLSYKDQNIKQVPKKMPLFHQLVQQLPYKVNIPRIVVRNGGAVYEELAVGGTAPGHIMFTAISAEIDGLTNIKTHNRQYYTLKGEAKLFDDGKLTAEFRYPVDSASSHFDISGTLSPMNIASANPMLVPMAKIKATNGRVEHIDFVISGNTREAKLDMLFVYNNLEVEVYKQKDDGLKKRNLLSNVVNKIIQLKDRRTPAPKDQKRIHTVTPADLHRSNFNYLWRTMRDGMKQAFLQAK